MRDHEGLVVTRAQSMDVLNDTTTMQSRIDTVLATPVLDYANDSGWHPGDPLYDYPRGYDSQVVRPLLGIIEELDWLMRCEPCQVSWGAGDTCWNCGAECPRPSYGLMPSMVEDLNRISEQMAQLTIPIQAFRERYVTDFVPDFVDVTDPEQWRHANSRCVLLPIVEEVNAPTIAEIQAATPVDIVSYLFPREPEEPVIRIPAGAEITPGSDLSSVPLPDRISVTGRRRRPPSPRFYFDRPVTEQRRPR